MDQTPKQQKRPAWGKRIGIVAAVFFVLLVVFYFVATSSSFIKAVVLPRAGAAINAKITAEDISVSPFSQARIQGLRVQTTGSEPLLTAADVRLRYSLMDIIKGNINVDEVTLGTPVIQIVQEADGTSNLDPILERDKKPESPKKSNEPTKLSIKNVSLKDGTVRQIVKSKDGSTKLTELQALNVTLDRLGNGQSGKLTLGASFNLDEKHGSTNSLLSGNIAGGYDIALNQQLLPENLKGSTKVTVTKALGAYQDAANFSTSLDADLTPKEIRQVALRFLKGDQQLGQLRLSGPLDIDKKEGNLKIEILSIDRNVLSLATAGKGMDLGNSVINSTNQVTISQGGTFFSAAGNLAGNRISVKKPDMTTPEMNLNVDYQANVNTSDKSAVLQRLNVSAETEGKQFLRTELDRQMNLSWGETVKGYKDAALRLILTNFNLTQWRAVVGTNLSSGIVNATVALTAQQDGKVLKTDINAAIDGLNAQFGSNRLENAAVTFQGAGNVEQLKVINLPNYSLSLSQNNSPVVKATGAARYSLDTKDTSAQLTADGALLPLLALAKVPDVRAQSGSLRVSANYTETAGKKTAVGNLGIVEFTGGYSNYSFTNFSVGVEYNVTIQQQDLGINQATVTFKNGFNTGGSVDLKGNYSIDKKSGQFSFKTVDLNQNTFGPILAPSLGENQLVSISLNASGDAALNPQGESSIKADVKLTNWLVHDKAGKLPKTPLSVGLTVDGGMRQQVLDLRQLVLQLTPNQRAKNALQMQAKLDLSKTNAAPSTLSIRSESFDLTPYYDMFAGGSTNAASAAKPDSTPAPAQAQTQPSSTPQEPPPMNLPFQQLTADLKIDRLYLRELAISNWNATVAIRSNVVLLKPFQLQLNGGAMDMTGNFDVGVPGYKYDLAFKADSVPLAPLANSFGSGSTNQLQGNFLANAQFRGAGITGPNLRKNLGGTVAADLTNMNYQVVGPKLRRILVPISVALRVPELTQTPINWVSLQSQIGNGTVDLKHVGVESEAFYAEVAGPITLADILTNSALNLPVDLSLRRALAEKAGLLSADTPTNAKYAKIPRFVSVKGTVGAPDPDINKLAVAGMLAKGAAAFGLGDAKTSQALGALGNVLTGQKASTNAAATNNSTANIIQGLGGLVTGSKATNAPAPAASPDTNATPAANLIRGLGGLLGGQQAAQPGGAKTNTAPTNNAVSGVIDSLLRPRGEKK